MTFTLTADEVSALEGLKNHFEHTGENIDRLLAANQTGDIGIDSHELECIYADTARGIEFAAGPNLTLGGIAMVIGAGYNFKFGKLNPFEINLYLITSKTFLS